MVITLRRACELANERPAGREQRAPQWSRDELAGRLTEISGQGAASVLTAAIGLVLEAQRDGEPVAWIMRTASSFFPPDVAASGVDLDALAVVRVPSAIDAARAADRLARSGAFGLIVADLGRDARVPTPLQGRLVGLAQRHDTAIVCLTDKSASTPSLGSMVSLRAAALREPAPETATGSGARFRCKVRVVKDKRRGPGWSHAEVVRGPAGLR